MTFLSIDACVLIGMPGISMPYDWWLARVLWTDGRDVLVEQHGIAGQHTHNALHPVSSVRAVGDIGFLGGFRQRADVEVRDLVREVHAAEEALGAARDAVWARIRAIGADAPGVEKPKERSERRRRTKARDALVNTDVREERRKSRAGASS